MRTAFLKIDMQRLGFRCHDLRHAFASRFLQATGDIPALQAILGHRSIQMTMCYAHMVTSHLHRAMADFGAKAGTKTGTIGTVSPGTADTDISARA
jgi:integrase/recombinase XerD